MTECLEKAGKEYKFVNYDDDMHGLHPQDYKIINYLFVSDSSGSGSVTAGESDFCILAQINL